MTATRRVFALVVGVFATVGVTGGGAGLVVVDWARTQFVVDAAGAQPAEFGPTFVAVVALQTTATLLLIGVGVAALVGTLAGSRFARVGTAGLVAGSGSLVGFYAMAALVVGLVTVAGGEGTGQVYDAGQALVPVVVAGLPAGVAGAVGGSAGAVLTR